MFKTANRWARWERTRARGERSFVWRYGVFGWGLAMAALWSVRYAFDLDARPAWWFGIPLNLLVFLPGGWWWGRRVWQNMEDDFRRHKQSRDGKPTPAPESTGE